MKKQTIRKSFLLTGAVLTLLTIFAISAFAFAKDIAGSYKTEIEMNGRAAQKFTLVVKRSSDGKLSATGKIPTTRICPSAAFRSTAIKSSLRRHGAE
ncbi:MAG TPA: hypothetical protein VF556_13765 [Pyrinomonadaceae bacterium]|jgi:hypothetical protein